MDSESDGEGLDSDATLMRINSHDGDEFDTQLRTGSGSRAGRTSNGAAAASTVTASSGSSALPAASPSSALRPASSSPSAAAAAAASSLGSSLQYQARHALRSSRVAEGGVSGLLMVMDSHQMERLKLHFRDPTTNRFDRALALDEFVEAFAAVFEKGKSRKEFKTMFMKIDANSDGSIDVRKNHNR